ncbi:hypothetical protein [Streptomyces sp. NPDC001893]|uniref:hypothetical protein n=1 Tax=Streptomyces sp. NPDC001893 TaxID=3154530 RepID=UPI00331CDE68
MKEWTDDEYLLYVNAREGSCLWEILADRTQSEDEKLWEEYTPVFSRLIVRWQRAGFLKVRRGPEWPAAYVGDDVPTDQIAALVQDPASWKYEEEPTIFIAVTVGDRPITDLEEDIGESPWTSQPDQRS